MVQDFRVAACAAACFALFAWPASAQTPPAAELPAYTVTAVGPGAEGAITARHDASMTVIDQPARPGHTEGNFAWPATPASRSWYDRSTGRNYAMDTTVGVPNCRAGTFSGDIPADPFAQRFDLAALHARPTGPATINGIATQRYEGRADGARITLWMEAASGLPVKVVASDKDGAERTLVEVRRLSLDKPPAGVMALPPACRRLAARGPVDPAAPSTVLSEGDEITARQILALTGASNPAAYRMAHLEPASPEACNVRFSVVAAGTLKPLTQGVDVQATRDLKRESLTDQIKGGVLHLPNVADHFQLQVGVTQGGTTSSTSADIYRQCFGKAESRLLYVSAPDESVTGAFLWVVPAGSVKPLPPAPALASADSVHLVVAGDEELRQMPQVPGQPVRWQRLSPGSLSTAEERSRDAAHVKLVDLVSQQDLTLDLQTARLVFQSGALGGSKAITRATAVVDGFNVTNVSTADGQVRLVAAGRWQAGGKRSGDWLELRRDAWSVYLREANGPGTLQLDLSKRQATQRAAAGEAPGDISAITDAQTGSSLP